MKVMRMRGHINTTESRRKTKNASNVPRNILVPTIFSKQWAIMGWWIYVDRFVLKRVR